MRLLVRKINDGPRRFTPKVLFVNCWSELNDWLEQTNADTCTRLDVLNNCYTACAQAEKWESAAEVARVITELAPESAFGFIQLGHALHRQRCTEEAWLQLLPLAPKYPEDWMIRYNLACYSCQLGHQEMAKRWLEQAMKVNHCFQIRSMALHDPDLEPLWNEILEIGPAEADPEEGRRLLVE